jgi:hypothetical protein
MKRPTEAALQQYREMMLTNPDTFKQKLESTYEELRSRSEAIWIELDLTKDDETMTQQVRDAQIERMELTIAQIARRMEAIRTSLDEEKDATNKLFTLNRKQRRAMEKVSRKGRGKKIEEVTAPLAEEEEEDEEIPDESD